MFRNSWILTDNAEYQQMGSWSLSSDTDMNILHAYTQKNCIFGSHFVKL